MQLILYTRHGAQTNGCSVLVEGPNVPFLCHILQIKWQNSCACASNIDVTLSVSCLSAKFCFNLQKSSYLVFCGSIFHRASISFQEFFPSRITSFVDLCLFKRILKKQTDLLYFVSLEAEDAKSRRHTSRLLTLEL